MSINSFSARRTSARAAAACSLTSEIAAAVCALRSGETAIGNRLFVDLGYIGLVVDLGNLGDGPIFVWLLVQNDIVSHYPHSLIYRRPKVVLLENDIVTYYASISFPDLSSQA